MGEKVGNEELEAPLDLENPPFPLTAIDRGILATKDEDYHQITWEDLQTIVGMPNNQPFIAYKLTSYPS